MLVRDLRNLGDVQKNAQAGGKALLGPETGALVALYARTLSAIERDRRKGGGRGELADKSMEELLEMARQVPELRDLLKDRE